MRNQTIKFARLRLLAFDAKILYTYQCNPSRYGYKVTRRAGATKIGA